MADMNRQENKTDPSRDRGEPRETKEQTLNLTAVQILSNLDLAHRQVAHLDETLFGGVGDVKENGPPRPMNIEGILSRCSELAMMLLDRLAVINHRAGSGAQCNGDEAGQPRR